MLTPESIRSLAANGEGYNAEFKISVPSKVRELSEEVCAFANAAGGVLLLGVDDQNEIRGIKLDNAKRSAIQNSLGEISPSLHCELLVVEVDGKSIGVIEVPSGPNKPYVLSGSIYVRQGPNTQKLTTAEQMRDFFQQTERICFDETPCLNFDQASELDEAFLAEFLAAARLSRTVPQKQIFQSLRLYTPKQKIKNGAVLFFGKEPQLYVEKAVLRCVAFQGTSKRYIIDDQPFGGCLHEQYLRAMQWLRGKMNVRYDIEGQGSKPRKEIWEIPETVFKEAIINSLSHRDYYEKGAVTTVEVFTDRVEITNPGGLVSGIRAQDFGYKSLSRNPLIFGLFSRMHLVEQIGSGIMRMNDLMGEANLPAPDFQTKGMFTVTLQRPASTVEKTVEESVEESVEEKIIELISTNPNVTAKEMMRATGATRRAVEYQLAKMKKSGRLQRNGSTKAGYWQLSD